MCAVNCLFFAAPTRSYIDDITSVELELTSHTFSAQYCLDFISTFTASPLNVKRQPPALRAATCGTETDFSSMLSEHTVYLGVPEKSSTSARDRIAAVRAAGHLSRSHARKLAGKIQSVLLHVPVARAVLQPIFDASESSSSSHALSDGVVAALDFLDEFLSNAASLRRAIPLFAASRPPVVIFSDASYAEVGIVAWIAFVPSSDLSRHNVFFAYETVPECILSQLHSLRVQSTYIMALEEIALISAFFSPELEPFLIGSDVLCFADNTAANGATVKGYSSAPDIARLINKFYLRLARLSSTRVWIEYINSSRNLADIPTRLDDPIMAARWRAFLVRTGATRLPFVTPSIFGWSG